MRWWWIAYEDYRRPAGERSLGVIVIQHAGGFSAAAKYAAKELGIAPDTLDEPAGGATGTRFGPPPAGYSNRLLSNAEAEYLAETWLGGLPTQEQRQAAIDDMQAPEGTPIFGGVGRRR